MKPARHSEQGAAAVELALVLLPLLLLLLGIVEFSRVFYTQLRLQQAAQQTVRQIALHYDDPGLAGLTGLINDTLLDTLDGVVDSLGELTYQDVDSCSTSVSTPQDASVVLQDTVALTLLPVEPVTVTGRATMPCEG